MKIYKKILKTISLILSIAVITSFLPCLVTAEKANIESYIVSPEITGYGLPQEGYSLPPEPATLFDDSYAEFENIIYTGLKNRETEITGLEKFGYTVNDKDAFLYYYYKVITDHPELYYVKTACSYSNLGGVICGVIPVYNTEFDEKSDEVFWNKVQEILNNSVYKGMTDEEIVLSIHDYLANYITYYRDYASTDAPEKIYSAYGAVVDGSAVCQGYSLAYILLLKLCGIESEYVRSEEMYHAWNVVKLNNNWYHVDVTWDDGYENGNPGETLVSHANFLRSDEQFKKGNGTGSVHTSWDEKAPKCTDDKYNDEKYVFNQKQGLGIGRYTYNNGYFYVINSFQKKYGKVSFDGSVCENITLSEYENAVSQPQETLPPIFEPTAEPSLNPTEIPSIEPTATPTEIPTIEPTIEPTATPTEKPAYTPEPYKEYYQISNVVYDENTGDLTVNINKIEERSGSDKFISAIYDANQNMKKIFIADISTDSEITIPSINIDETDIIKIFVWDDINTMYPLFNAQKIDLKTINAVKIEYKVFELVNQERAAQGLDALVWNEDLAYIARAHSCDMSERGFFDHINPDGLSPFDRMKNYGITYSSAAENIAAGATSPEDVMQLWMNSEGHRSNILNSSLTDIGVGLCISDNGYGYYWTQTFIAK